VKKKSKKKKKKKKKINRSIDDEKKKRLTRFRSLFPTMMKRCNMMSVRKENDLLTKSGDAFILRYRNEYKR
jgi:16S rRNA G527 N7-methylase RsmG